MPLFFLIAIGAGVITTGSVVLDANKMMKRNQSAQALTIDAANYASIADCLTVASTEGVPLSSCQAQQ